MTRLFHFQRRRGAGLVVALVTLLVVTLMSTAIVQLMIRDHRETRQTANELQAHLLADAALARAVIQIKADPQYAGETWKPVVQGSLDETEGIAEIRIQRPENETHPVQVTVEAHYPDHPWRRVAVSRTLTVGQAASLSRTPENSP